MSYCQILQNLSLVGRYFYFDSQAIPSSSLSFFLAHGLTATLIFLMPRALNSLQLPDWGGITSPMLAVTGCLLSTAVDFVACVQSHHLS